MSNVRSKQQSVKNKKNHDNHSLKSCNLVCSCSANSKFKRNQSGNKFTAKSDPWIQTNKDSDTFSRNELKRYGCDVKKLTDPKFKHNSLGQEKNCCVNVNILPTHGVQQRGVLDQQKLKSKTDSNLAYEKYVEDLKNEIKAQRENIPTLPKKYKQKYLNSLKEELMLNKVASAQEDKKNVKELIKEIQIFRTFIDSPYTECMKSPKTIPHKVQPCECKDPARSRKHNVRSSSENGSVKGGKTRKSKKRSPRRYKSQDAKLSSSKTGIWFSPSSHISGIEAISTCCLDVDGEESGESFGSFPRLFRVVDLSAPISPSEMYVRKCKRSK